MYNHYYHEDGTSLSIDNLDCGSDAQCQFMYQDRLIFDDYGFPPGEVKQAIDEKVTSGALVIDIFIPKRVSSYKNE